MLRVLAITVVLLTLTGWPHLSYAQQVEPGYFPDTVQNDLAGMTVRFASDRHGSGVLYFAPDGRAFMWRPGRIKVNIGHWSGDTMQSLQVSTKTLTTQELIVVTFPPSFKDRLGIFVFLEATRIHDDLGVKELSEGDALGLEDGEPPCRICRADMTFSRMLGG